MSESKVTGVVDGISDYKRNDYFNIALENAEVDDNWYIGDGTLRDYGDIEKGDKVRLHVENGSVTKVDVIKGDGQNKDEGTRDVNGKSADQHASPTSSDSGAGEGSDAGKSIPKTLSKDKRIMLQVAFKEAAETMRHEEENLDNELSQAEKLEVVGEYTNGFYNLLQAQVKDKVNNQ